MVSLHSGDCSSLLSCYEKHRGFESHRDHKQGDSSVVEHVKHSFGISLVKNSSDVKGYFALLKPWSQVRFLLSLHET